MTDKKYIYFDNAASTKPYKEACDIAMKLLWKITETPVRYMRWEIPQISILKSQKTDIVYLR